MKLKVGDKVKVIYGKDKGRTSEVTQVIPKEGKVVVKDINTYKRHIKKQSADQPGGIVKVERPIDASKVQLISPHTDEVTRVGYQITKTGEKVRIDKKTGKPIDVK